MSGQYVEVISIVAPNEAVAGGIVDVTVTIRNISSYELSAMVGACLEYGVSPWPEVTFPYNSVTLNPGESHSFNGPFTMPDKDVTIHAYSYWYGTDGYWHFDDEKTRSVNLTTIEVGFRNLDITSWIKV